MIMSNCLSLADAFLEVTNGKNPGYLHNLRNYVPDNLFVLIKQQFLDAHEFIPTTSIRSDQTFSVLSHCIAVVMIRGFSGGEKVMPGPQNGLKCGYN